MGLLFDKLERTRLNGMMDDIDNDGNFAAGRADMEATQVFEISNVLDLTSRMRVTRPRDQEAQHLLATGEGRPFQEKFLDAGIETDLSAFPNVAPPFRSYWMETHVPAELRLEVLDTPTGQRLGVWSLVASETDVGWQIISTIFMEHEREAKPVALWVMECGKDGVTAWLGEMQPVMEKSAGEVFSPRVIASLTENAFPIKVHELDGKSSEYVQEIIKQYEDEQERQQIRLHKLLLTWLSLTIVPPVLMAHSLLACKNVTTDEHRPDPKLARARRKRGGNPGVTFKTLAITPMGGTHSTGERISIGGGNTALHLVRGHFKTFSEEKPLFGKHAGTYWWSPMARGKEEHGTVHKTYEVRT